MAAVLLAAGWAIQPAAAQTQQPAVPTFQTAPAQAAPVAPAAGAAGVGNQGIVIGILDTQRVLNESSVGKSLNAQWGNAMKALDEDANKKDEALRAQAKALDSQRLANPPTITPDDYNAKAQLIQQQSAQLHQSYNKSRDALDQRRTKALETVTAAARKAMQDSAKAHGMTLIIDRSAAPYSSQTWNITDDVILRLNKALPNIKL